MAITVGDVLNTAIQFAQLDSQFLPMARLYYNLALREQTRDFKWPFFRVTGGTENFIAGQLNYDLPEDYARGDTVYLYSQGQRGREIKIVDPTIFDQLKVSDVNLIGTPRICKIDQDLAKLVFECAPNQDGYQLNYFRKATEIDTQGSNDADAPDYEDEMMLIQKITQLLMEYTDDERYSRKMQEVDKKLREAKLNVYDTDANSVINLSNSVHVPGRRPSRGGNGGGWGSNF